MTELDELERAVEERLRGRLRRAERAYVLAHHVRETLNCRHHGSKLAEGVFACRLRCVGMNEQAAASCHNEKARSCPDFSPPQEEERLRAEFRALDEAELGLRWPSIGSLLWVQRQIRQTRQRAPTS